MKSAIILFLTICTLYCGDSLACNSNPKPAAVESEAASANRRNSPNQRLLGGKKRMTRAEIDHPDFQAVVQKSLAHLRQTQSNGCLDYELVEVQEATRQLMSGNKYEWKMILRPKAPLTKLRCPQDTDADEAPASDAVDAVDAAQPRHYVYQSSAWVRPWLKEEERHLFTHQKLNA